VLQRILGVVLVVAGLGAIVFGVATATVLRESDSVVATAAPAGDGTLVVTDPGVLGLVDSDVTVTASVPQGQEVTVVVGRDVDVEGWIGEDPYTRVTGLSDWETLATEEVVPETDESEEPAESEDADAAPPADPAGSDMWVTELSDAEQVTLRWTDRPGRWVLLAAGTGPAPVEDGAEDEQEGADAPTDEAVAQAPTLELTWDRQVGTPLLWPAVGGGAVLLLIGVVLLIAGRRRRKRSRRSTAAAGVEVAAPASNGSGASPASTSSPARDDVASSPAPSAPTTLGSGASGWPAAASGTPSTSGTPVPAPFAAGGQDGADTGAGETTAETPAEPAAQDDETVESSSASGGRTGTAPVPVAGRFRRSRLRRRSDDGAPAASDGPAAPAADGPAPVPAPVPAPSPATGSDDVPADAPTSATSPTLPEGRPLTRRELRRREEERRAAEQTGVGRAFRALTGQTPAVPPAAAPAPEDGTTEATGSRRASAWRETWGFGDAAGTTKSDDTTDGGAR